MLKWSLHSLTVGHVTGVVPREWHLFLDHFTWCLYLW